MSASQPENQHLDDFFENAPIGCHWINPDGTILRANRAQLELLGYRKEEWTSGHISDFHADRHIAQDLLDRLSRNETLRNFKARLRCQNGEIKHALIDATPVCSNGQLSQARCFVRDMDDQEQASHVTREQYQELEDYLSIIVHDLRRPLISLQLLLETLKEDKPEEATIDLILSEFARMNQMLSILMEISRIDHTEIKREPVRLKQMLDELVQRFRQQIDEKKANVCIECPDVETIIPRLQLGLCIENLLDNALKFGCPQPNCRIHIRCSIEARQATISVRDEGPGIALADQQRAFEPFRRLKNAYSIPGSGVGLTAVQKHMKKIRGTVSLSSTPNAGAEFILIFPCE